MTDPVSLPFELNQGQLDEAIASAMPSLIADLAVTYVSGRPPKGLNATVTLTEAQIREAVIAHARRLVNPSFRHFSISFKATRGDDGLTTSIIASTHPIAPAPTQGAEEVDAPTTTKAAEPTPAPVAEEPTPVASDPVVTAEPEAAEVVSDVAVEAAEEEKAPWSEEATPAEVAPAAEAEAVQADATADASEEVKPAPSAGRSRLFADLQRPKND